jgi:hypothetical protein
MAYRFRHGENVESGLRRIAAEQIGKAIDEVSAANRDVVTAVHFARRRCKKLRGLIRLVRPVFPHYGRENLFYRDAARGLAAIRDNDVALRTYDRVLERFGVSLDVNAFAPIRARLADRCNQVTQDAALIEERLGQFVERMHAARERAAAYAIEAEGFEAVRGGLMATYRRGRRARRVAARRLSRDALHEWRKEIKHYWHHLRLLRGVWPRMIAVPRRSALRLSELVGDGNDLALLRGALMEVRDDLDTGRFDILLALIDFTRAEIAATALARGERLYAEAPKQLAARIGGYWRLWDARPAQPQSPIEEARAMPARRLA